MREQGSWPFCVARLVIPVQYRGLKMVASQRSRSCITHTSSFSTNPFQHNAKHLRTVIPQANRKMVNTKFGMKAAFLFAVCLLDATNVPVSAVTCSYVGNGLTNCRLEVTQDVSLERASINYNSLGYLLIAEHTGFPLKRSLLQFEDFTTSNGCTKVSTFYTCCAHLVITLSRLARNIFLCFLRDAFKR